LAWPRTNQLPVLAVAAGRQLAIPERDDSRSIGRARSAQLGPGGDCGGRQLIVRGHANLLEDLHALEDLERVKSLSTISKPSAA